MLLTMRIDAEKHAEVLERVDEALRPSAVPAGVDVNALPRETQRELIRAEMRRKQARGTRGR